jgi:hypothetical protein
MVHDLIDLDSLAAGEAELEESWLWARAFDLARTYTAPARLRLVCPGVVTWFERLRGLGLGRGARLLQQPLQSRRQEKGTVKMLLLMLVFPTDSYVVSTATYSTYLPEIINTMRLRER